MNKNASGHKKRHKVKFDMQGLIEHGGKAFTARWNTS